MNKTKLTLIISAVFLLTMAFVFNSRATAQSRTSDDFVDQLIIKYRNSENMDLASADQINTQMRYLSNAAGISLEYFRPMSGEAHVLRLPDSMPIGQAEQLAAQLSALPEVEYAEPDYIMTAIVDPGRPLLLTPGDPLYTNQWHYFTPSAGNYGVNAPPAWDITTGSSSIYVAVLDTGILNHDDLTGRWTGGYDMISDPWTANDGDGRDSDPHDPGDWVAINDCGSGQPARNSSWHGSHVAGTIAAASDNSQGVAGLNWVSLVVPVRVLGRCGGSSSDIADAIRWAAGLSVTGVPSNANPVQVINMSLGGGGTCGTTFQDAINAAYNSGTMIVVSAGNSNDDAANFQPASCNNVVTVASTDRYGDRAYYSNYGTTVEISAPGGDTRFANSGVLSTLNTGTTVPVEDAYIYYQGTSMAAPHVAGVASLVLSVDPSLTPAETLTILQNTVTSFPGVSTCTTSLCGSGIVNAGLAVQSVNPPVIEVDPTVLEASLIPDAQITQTLTISNTGASGLDWLIEEDNSPGSMLTSQVSYPGQQDEVTLNSRGDLKLSHNPNTQPGISSSLAPIEINSYPATITHSSSQTIVSGNSVSCSSSGIHADNSYLRRFTLADFGIEEPFTITSVDIGIELATAGSGGVQPATVNLYLWDPTDLFEFANFTMIGTTDVDIADQTLAIVNIPVTSVAPVGSTLVVEFFTPAGFTDSNSLYVGSNTGGQTDATFFAAADCGITEPIAIASIGFPDMHLVMNVNGSVGDVSCDLPEDIPWLSLSPTSGTVTPDLSDALDVVYDSTGLATGEYTGTLCIDSNDPVTPQVQVPVTMTVCTQPAAVTDVSISRSGNHVTLDWTAVTGATAYRIYRAANDPYYTPGMTFIYDLAPTNTYTDLGAAGDTANNYYYVVQVVNTCGAGSVESPESNRTAEFDYPIQPGTP